MLLRTYIMLVLVCLLLPAVYLIQNIINVPSFFEQFDQRLLRLTYNSVSCALLTSLLTLLIATPLAFLFSHYQFIFKKSLFVIFCIPLIIPSYILSYSYQSLAHPLGFELTGFWGTTFILTLANYPLALLFILNSLRQYDYQLDESSYILGYNKVQTFYKITFWQILPALLSSSIIICLYSLGDFGTPALMNFPTFTREIKLAYDLGLLNQANTFTLFLIVIAFFFIFLSEKFKRQQQTYSNNSTKQHTLSSKKISNLGKLSSISGFIILITLILLPLIQILIWFKDGIASEKSSFGLFQTEITNSIILSLATTILTFLFCFPTAYFNFLNKQSKLNKIISFINFFGNAIPGIALAFCIIFLFSKTNLYQTFFIMAFTLTLRFFAQAYNPLKNSFELIHPNHYESAKLLGKTSWQSFWLIIFPQIKTSLIISLTIVFVFTFKELAITLLMAPPGFNTLPQKIWAFMDEGEFSQIGIPIFCVIAISSFLLINILYSQKFNQEKI